MTNLNREHELTLANNPPTPDQLKRLSMIGIRSAASRHQLKSLQRTPHAHFYVEEMDLFNEHGNIENTAEMRHRMAGRVGVRAFDQEQGTPKVWSLKYFDTFWVRQGEDDWLAQRTLYRFEWNRMRTLMAERTFRELGNHATNQEVEELGEYVIDGLAPLPDDLADIWHAQNELATVTSGDVEDLIDRANSYFDIVHAINRAA